MRRCAFLLALLAGSAGLSAEEEALTPFLVFREPDPATKKRIQRDLITEKQLAGRVPDVRRATREELAAIGPWCVPFLADALYGRARQSSARIRLNAVIALALIRDPRGLDALRGAAAKDDDISVRRAATLVIPLFGCRGEPRGRPDDFATLDGILKTPRGEWRCTAPAIAKLRHRDGPAFLNAAAEKLPRDEHDAAAILLAAAIAGPDAPLVAHLEDKADLVQEACAAGLAVRPLPPARVGELLAALKRTKLSGTARVLAIRALGAITPRPPEAQAALLDLAAGDGPAAERIAAVLELAGRADELDALRKAYRRVAGRNDPIVAALLFALARTRQKEAFDELLGVVQNESDQLRFYAAASLLYVCAFEPEIDDPDRILAPVAGLKAPQMGALAGLATRLRRGKDLDAVRKDIRGLEDPRDLRLFSCTREERNWLEVNRLLARIFELREVLNQFDSTRPGRVPESALGGGTGGDETHKAASGSDEEQDLFDLLLPPKLAAPEGQPPYPERKAYFGPGDLGG